MPSWKQHFGNYLKGEEITRPIRVTVDHVTLADMKTDDGRTERKLVVHFEGKEKGMVLNQTNCETLEGAAGTIDYDQWGGTVIELYYDPTVKFGSKTVGGLRLRAVGKAKNPDPRPEPPHPAERFADEVQAAGKKKPAAVAAADVTEDDIPF